MRSISKKIVLAFVCSMLVLGAALPALAQVTPIPITAEQAFDAVQKGIDPTTGLEAKTRFVLVDIRTHAEYHWVGAAAQVTAITMEDGKVVTPDFGKVKLLDNGTFIEYHVDGRYKRTLVQKVESMTPVAIAKNVAYQTWDEEKGNMVPNLSFGAQMKAIAGNEKPALILFCRSGGRTDTANAVAKLGADDFSAIYEIDDPGGVTNTGGMEGANYSNVYNGHRGFPERNTSSQLGTKEAPSASWKDAGLPIVIGLKDWVKE